MSPRPPAQIGMPAGDIETPALVVDLDLFDANLATLRDAVRGSGLRLRPHGKAHKCPDIARHQMAAGAIGLCCQKVSEAEVFVAAGIPDILVTNEIVDPRKLARLVALAERARIGVCVDGMAHVEGLKAAVAGKGVTVDVLVEIDVGQGRCGMPPGPEMTRLAAVIADTPGLVFAGLQAYHGGAQHLRQPEERRAAIADAAAAVRRATALLDQAGLACRTVTGAGTGSFGLEMASGAYTELQCGSYALMDADYARNRFEGPVFAHALLVHATVISTAVAGQAVLDAGYKALAVDSGRPVPFEIDTDIIGMSDEHTLLRQPKDRALVPGDRVRLIPGHVDPTVNLHDWFVGVRSGVVEALWPIAARGPGL
ncbi:DSD1 family PLP-dependent enzyme [Aquabacter spiritensis]|uniref:D-serine deaminase-like pyridoxal phosphate-dependent protein n=1 Tax=Aquabacter spiritensis TaxID=933073 RepID=A0A4R3M1T4_9HYPH|nr:DSD1 family PLP-dependent enzyme [Aquabacter spiritensis]TCT05127.1 D-serine deaminase-like pyridoxal phosphate-dependent protein [Aquabacter spiritensis]